jgi:hypothetical protein
LMTRRQPTSDSAAAATEPEYAFQVKLVAVVWVRATDKVVARKVIPSVLGSPGTAEIRLVNETNNSLGLKATVTGVDFLVKGDSAVLLESNDKKVRRRR